MFSGQKGMLGTFCVTTVFINNVHVGFRIVKYGSHAKQGKGKQETDTFLDLSRPIDRLRDAAPQDCKDDLKEASAALCQTQHDSSVCLLCHCYLWNTSVKR